MNNKLNLLVRENKGRLMFDEVRSTLEALIAHPIMECASLPKTDDIVELHKTAYRKATLSKPETLRLVISAQDSAKVDAFLHCFEESFKGEIVYYTPKQSEYVGALMIALSPALSAFRGLLKFDGDSLQLTSQNEKNGLFLDWNRDDMAAQFELVVWGESWVAGARRCFG
jgi:hypothetical protein